MITALLLSGAIGLAALAGDEPPSGSPALSAYQSAAAAAGRDADAHVRLALWCEAHGLTAERLKHLVPGGPLPAVERAGPWTPGIRRISGGMGPPRGDRGADPERPGPTIAHSRLPRPPRTDAPHGRGPDEAGGLVRGEAVEGPIAGPLPRGDPARSLARGGLEASGLPEAKESLGQARGARGGETGSRAAEAGG